MDYQLTFCKQTGPAQGDYRFSMGQDGKRMLFVIGLNPSTADERHPDPTVRKVMGFAKRGGYDGFAVLNLSSERATDKRKLAQEPNEKMHRLNLTGIAELAERYPAADIWCAWGDGITEKFYLPRCFMDIYDMLRHETHTWLKNGSLTVRGNPRHPLYGKYDWGLTAFDIEAYRSKLESKCKL